MLLIPSPSFECLTPAQNGKCPLTPPILHALSNRGSMPTKSLPKPDARLFSLATHALRCLHLSLVVHGPLDVEGYFSKRRLAPTHSFPATPCTSSIFFSDPLRPYHPPLHSTSSDERHFFAQLYLLEEMLFYQIQLAFLLKRIVFVSKTITSVLGVCPAPAEAPFSRYLEKEANL